MKKLYIRADGNKILGLGHMMRCMSIADAYVEAGGECEFIVSDEEAAMIASERQYKASVLNSKWDNLSFEMDIMRDFIEKNQVELLLVDSYYADAEYLKNIHRYTKLVYLTGKSDKSYDIDGLINYTIGSDKLGYEELYENKNTKLFIGVEYTPLRKQFDVPLLFREEVKDILVTTGGTDGLGLPVFLMNEIERTNSILSECNWHIVKGKFFSENVKAELQKLSKASKKIKLYENVTEMAELMRKCDLAVSAAGSTLYELCACGIPVVAFSFVDNQIRALQEFEKEGYVFSAGDIREDKKESIRKIVEFLNVLKMERTLREKQAVKMKKFIDGKGAKRLAVALQSF